MMVLSSLVALAAAQRFFQAPAPGSVPMAAAYAVPNMAPVPGAFPSVTVAATSSAAPSRSPALSIAAGAALGATVAVLFGSGKKAGAKKAAPKKAAAKKPAAKPAAKKAAPAPAKKGPAVSRAAMVRAPAAKSASSAPRRASVPRSGRYDGSARGKGGIFPWIQNEPGTYAKPLMLSRFDFTGDDGDKFVGWGGMPPSVKALYNPNGRKGLLGGCITPAK